QHHSGLARRARIAFSGMHRALLMAYQHMDEFIVFKKGIVDRKHRSAGIAEDVLHALILERANNNFRPGQFVTGKLSSLRLLIHARPSVRRSCATHTKGASPPLSRLDF